MNANMGFLNIGKHIWGWGINEGFDGALDR